jgi:hypothetical protein
MNGGMRQNPVDGGKRLLRQGTKSLRSGPAARGGVSQEGG